ncbi:MAG: adenylosuccinate synthase [Elusimicrobia bacterium]|nr:adenylosuccinate synthase [Elusimicrobiota bacterium]
MPALVVVGAQWGDEGKGKIVHWLASRARMVVRYQGGDNAGHTVVFGGKSFALHSIPSGILVPGALSVLGNGVILNPRALRGEARALERAGIRVRGRLFISPLCHMILPTHLLLDALREEGAPPAQRTSRRAGALGPLGAAGRGIGTTKKGIGPCYEDKIARIGIRLCDYLDKPLFEELVERNLGLRSAELSRLKPLRRIRQEVFEGYGGLCAFLRPFVADASLLIEEALSRGRNVLFEGAQGAMLDVDFGTYPFVTSSSPAAGGACVGAGVGPTRIGAVLGVSKAYTTRVGLGPFPTEITGRVGRCIREVGREYGTTTGRPRRIGWLDLVQLKYALRVGGIGALAITKLDTLSGIHPLRVCASYRLGRRRVEDFPCSRREVLDAEPVYEELPGFSGDISKSRSFEALPKGARDYILFIEKRLGVKAAVVSVGQSREQTIARASRDALWGA